MKYSDIVIQFYNPFNFMEGGWAIDSKKKTVCEWRYNKAQKALWVTIGALTYRFPHIRSASYDLEKLCRTETNRSRLVEDIRMILIDLLERSQSEAFQRSHGVLEENDEFI